MPEQNRSLGRPRLWKYHLHSLWLFTFSDIKTIIAPKTIFGIMNAISSSAFGIRSTPMALSVLNRVLPTIIWVWINLLPFNIDNQRQPAAILEDSLNKPWRPMPSKRLTELEAKSIMFVLYPTAVLVSMYSGGLKQCIALNFLGYWYNDCGGSDSSCISRNLINACGFICFASGAMEVALGFPLPLEPYLLEWFFVIGCVVFSTVQMQDIYDQAGDRLRGRKTVSLVFGDGRTRWLTAICMAFWCIICPWYWNLLLSLRAAFMMLGVTIIGRLLWKRSVEDDKLSFRLWNLWMVFVYTMPLMSYFSRS